MRVSAEYTAWVQRVGLWLLVEPDTLTEEARGQVDALGMLQALRIDELQGQLLRRAVRDWFAARYLAFRHDDRPLFYPSMAAWRKAGAKKWERVRTREERVLELVTTRPKEANR